MAAGRPVHAVPALPDAIIGSVARPGWLEDWRLAAAVTAVGIAVLAAWSWTAVRDHRHGRRRPHPVLRRVALSGLTVLTLLAGAGLAANSYAGYAPDAGTLVRAVPSLLGYRSTGGATADPGAAVPGSSRPRLISMTLADRADRIPPGRDWIYLPAGYDDPANAHRRYPVAYLIHGYPSSSYDWFGAGRAGRTAGLMQRLGLMGPMILVSPDATGGTRHDTECLNSSVGGPRLETFLTTTLVRTVDRDYRTIPDRADRIIGGVSSGGFCALNLGLRHQAEFGIILSVMPAGDPGVNAVRFMFGGDARLGRLNSPSAYAATLPLRHPQFVFLSASLDDRDATAVARSMARTLAARGVFTALRVDPPGLGHTWREARRQIPYAFAFATAHLGPARAGTAAPPPLGLGAAWDADARRSGIQAAGTRPAASTRPAGGTGTRPAGAAGTQPAGAASATQPARTARSYRARTSAPK